MLITFSKFHETENKLLDEIREETDIFWHPAYYRGLRLVHGDESRAVLVYLSRSDWAIYCFFISEKEQQRIALTPYGYGGYLQSSNCRPETVLGLDDQVQRFLLSEGVVSEEIRRVHPFLCGTQLDFETYTFNPVRHSRLMECDVLFEEQVKSPVMRGIRKAKREGLFSKVYFGGDINTAVLATFYEQYVPTMKRAGAAQYYFWPFDAFVELVNSLSENVAVVEIHSRQECVASYLCFFTRVFFTFYLCGYVSSYLAVRPNNLAYQEMHNVARHLKCQWVHIGGGTTVGEDGLHRFKSQFGRVDRICYAGRRILDSSASGSSDNS